MNSAERDAPLPEPFLMRPMRHGPLGFEGREPLWTNGMGAVPNAQLAAGLCDARLLEFACNPPECDLDRRDTMMAGPLMVDSSGVIILSDRPGMGYEVDFNALGKTRVA